jgi:hypothetical protein
MESGSKVHKFNELMSLFCSELKRKNCLFSSLRQAGTNENTVYNYILFHWQSQVKSHCLIKKGGDISKKK